MKQHNSWEIVPATQYQLFGSEWDCSKGKGFELCVLYLESGLQWREGRVDVGREFDMTPHDPITGLSPPLGRVSEQSSLDIQSGIDSVDIQCGFVVNSNIELRPS